VISRAVVRLENSGMRKPRGLSRGYSKLVNWQSREHIILFMRGLILDILISSTLNIYILSIQSSKKNFKKEFKIFFLFSTRP